ncbi:hypothetical protein GPALN_013168 [Globodera pallida]|uniref:B30.2/SPRY domain-containing protein n=1 Tax=Globodera pallida TaxID=36090 RepID=A0A183CI75_GLOPA|nr:hypothetical protein GPALN_013168 [Globodera pallida]
MPTFLFLVAICLLVGASILLETDASPKPKPNKKREKRPSSSGNAESTPELTPENRWATPVEPEATPDKKLALREPEATPDKKLALIEIDGLIAKHNGEKIEYRSVCAEGAIPKGNSGFFYYEVKILEKEVGIYIGLAPNNEIPLHVGYNKGTYGYGSRGEFWGHEVEGCSHDWKEERPYRSNDNYFFGAVGDVIGCGVDLKTRQIIYTKKGKLLNTAGLKVDSDAELYPCVTLYEPGTKIEANFGKEEFIFNIAKAFKN